MSCPYYEDLTRMCIDRFPTILPFQNFSDCEKETYKNCPVYMTITSDYVCKYLDECIKTFLEGAPKFYSKLFSDKKAKNLIDKLLKNYCLSESNSNTCERYKRYELGEKPSYKIFSDGKIRYLDIIFNR